jgi:hypothetical protein
MNPTRLAASPQVIQMERVVVSAPAQAAVAAVTRGTATN